MELERAMINFHVYRNVSLCLRYLLFALIVYSGKREILYRTMRYHVECALYIDAIY